MELERGGVRERIETEFKERGRSEGERPGG